MTEHKTRFWSSPSTSTCVQFRTDDDILVWMHTNMGWIPIGNAPKDAVEAEKFAEECAAGYSLEEACQEHAQEMAGWE